MNKEILCACSFAVSLGALLTSCYVDSGLVYDVPNSAYDVYGFSMRDLEDYLSEGDRVNSGLVDRNSQGTLIKLGVWSRSGNRLLELSKNGLAEFEMPAEFSYTDDDNRFVAWYPFTLEYGGDRSNDYKVVFSADSDFRIVANSSFDVDHQGRYFVYEPDDRPGVVRISACKSPKTTLIEFEDVPREYLRRNIYSSDSNIYIVSTYRDGLTLSQEESITRLHYAQLRIDSNGSLIVISSRTIAGLGNVETSSSIPIDLEPSEGLLLIEVMRWKWYQRNPWYLYNLDTDTYQHIGSASQYGMFLTRDVLKELEASRKR